MTEREAWLALAADIRAAGDPPPGWPAAHKRGEGGAHSALLSRAHALVRRYPKIPPDAPTADVRRETVMLTHPWLSQLGAIR